MFNDNVIALFNIPALNAVPAAIFRFFHCSCQNVIAPSVRQAGKVSTAWQDRTTLRLRATFSTGATVKRGQSGFIYRRTPCLDAVIALGAVTKTCQCRFFKEKRSEEHTSELQSRGHLVCRLLLEKKKEK